MKAVGISCEEVLEKLSAFKDQSGDEYGLRSLGVFGSFVRGDATSLSDIDIVFETDRPNLFRTSRMKQELETLLERHVDVVRLREHMNPRLKNGYCKRRAMSDSSPLRERLESVLEALERIPRRIAGVDSAEVFLHSSASQSRS